MRVIIAEKKDILAGTVRRHEANRISRGALRVEKGDISAATVFVIQTAQTIGVEGVGADVADFVVEEGIRAEETRVGEALVALIRQKKGQVQPRMRNQRKRKNHHQKVQ